MNVHLFLLILALETLLLLGGYLLLQVFYFLYYASGAGASTHSAVATGSLLVILLSVSPALFGWYKTYTLPNKRNQKTYLHAGLLASLCSLLYVDVVQCINNLYYSSVLNTVPIPLYSCRNSMRLS